MKNCYDLSLNFLPIDLKFLNGLEPEQLLTIGISSLSQDCVDWINLTGLEFRDAHVFVRAPFSGPQAIHIDGRPGHRRNFGVNWNFNTENFEMRWYKAIKESSPVDNRGLLTLKDTELNYSRGVIYTKYNPDEVELIETSRSTGPVLFNTSIPHTVVNFTDKPRYSVSLTFKDKINWADAVEVLRPWIKES